MSRLLAAATTPARADELVDEARALAEFRAAMPLTPLPVVPTVEGAPLMTRSLRKLAAAPALALGIAGAVVASGGVALAASGALHVPFTGHDNRSDRAPSAPASTNPGLTVTAPHTDEPTATEAPETPEAQSTPSASPSPSLVGLCHAFQAGAMHDGKTNPAFNALTSAAGGAQNLTTYCVSLIGAPASHPAVTPTHPAKPTHAANPQRAAKPTQAANPTVVAGQSGHRAVSGH